MTRVDGVETVTTLTSAVTAGGTSLPVDDASGFAEGDTIQVVESTVGVVSAVDTDANTLTIPALGAGFAADDPVVLLGDDGQPVVVRHASVDPDEDGLPPITALVDPGLEGLLEGVYDPGVPVEMEFDGGAYTVTRRLDDRPGWNPHSYRTVNTDSIPPATHTPLTSFTDVETDGLTFASGSWTVSYGGWYSLTAWVTWDLNSTGRRRARFLVNGVLQLVQVVPAEPDTQSFNQATLEIRLQERDVVQLWVYQTSGVDLSVIDGAFSIHRISI